MIKISRAHFVRTFATFVFMCLSLTGLRNASAQTNEGIDPTYTPTPTGIGTNFMSGGFTIQPDGKILVYRGFSTVNGVQRLETARLNADGSLDASFDCPVCSTFDVTSAVVQANGKIVIAGFRRYTDAPRKMRVYRIEANGALDSTFTPVAPVPVGMSEESAAVLAVTPDGKSYVAVRYSFSGTDETVISRYNSDGSFDDSFVSVRFNHQTDHFFSKARLLSDGKLLIGGKHPFGFLFRVNPDGSRDLSFASPVLAAPPLTSLPMVSDFDIEADGKIPFVGFFSSVNNVARKNFARLNADGSLDQNFNPQTSYPSGSTIAGIYRIALQPSGKLIVSGRFEGAQILRFNPDGSPDSSFSTTQTSSNWQLDSLGRLFMCGTLPSGAMGYLRLTADGAPDPTFVPPVIEVGPLVSAAIVQADGKAIVSGNFGRFNGVFANRLVRLLPDGAIDGTFYVGSGPSDLSSGPNAAPTVIEMQPDGKILIGGTFDIFDARAVGKLARLNQNGALDFSFRPSVNPVPFRIPIRAISVQSDGKILIGGDFSAVGGQPRDSIARLNADGSLDSSFDVSLDSGSIYSIVVEPDGKIVIGGYFTRVNNSPRAHLARLNANGTLDESFNAGSLTAVQQIVRGSDGKYTIATANQVFRRNADGTPDNSFQTATFTGGTETGLSKIVVRGDQTVTVGGSFNTINGVPRRNIARLRANGRLDPYFLPSGADDVVTALALQADGKILAGGSFRNIGGVSRLGLARIQNLPVIKSTPFDFDGDGRADYGVFRPSNGTWYQLTGPNYNFSAAPFGISSDIITPADYDGDGRTDIAVFRDGNWYLFGSTSGFLSYLLGQSGDVPLPADLDGDGRAELLVFRPSNGVWYTLNPADNQRRMITFGNPTDRPVPGDYDGDGKIDLAVFRPATGQWFYAASSQNGAAVLAATWGIGTDKAVPADYDGDGKTDAAIFRDGIWAIKNSGNASETIIGFGAAGDLPVAADYDGDGRADVAVFRPSNGTWYVFGSTSGFQAASFGANGDRPIPNAYVR